MALNPINKTLRNRFSLKNRRSRRKTRAPIKREWRASAKDNIPWTSILAILTIVLAAAAAATVILVADRKTAVGWNVSPTVVLSTLATLTGICIRYTFEEAATVWGWRQVLKGTTIEQLYNEYQFSKDPMAAVLKPFHSSSTLRWASILTALFALNGPLLQQAIKLESISDVFRPEIVVPVQVRPMWNLTIRNDESGSYQPEFRRIVEDAKNSTEMKASANICRGECQTTVILASFDQTCWPISPSLQQDKIKKLMSKNDVYHLKVEAHNLIDWDPSESGKGEIPGKYLGGTDFDTSIGGIKITYLYKPTSNSTEIRYEECVLQPAYVYRDISIINETIALDQRLSGTVVPRTAAMMSTSTHLNVTMGGWIKFLKEKYEGRATYEENLERGYSTVDMTENALAFFDGGGATQKVFNSLVNATSIGSEVSLVRKANTGLSFRDPIKYIYLALDELSLRYAFQKIPDNNDRKTEWITVYGNDLKSRRYSAIPYEEWDPNPFWHSTPILLNNGDNQSCMVTQVHPSVVLRMNIPTLIAALLLTLIPTTVVSFMLSSWKFIGRRVSMSPLKIAKAFDAPVLRNSLSNSNATTSDVVRAIGDRRIRYGSMIFSRNIERSNHNREATDLFDSQNSVAKATFKRSLGVRTDTELRILRD